MKKFYTKIEKDIVENSTFIITVSNPITEYFKKTYKKENAFTIYTGYDPDDYAEIPNEHLINEKDFFKIVFTGRLNLSDSTNKTVSFFDAVNEISKENPKLSRKIKIYLAGEFSSDELKYLKDLIKAEVVVNCGYLDRKEAIKLQWSADLLLLITSITRSSIVTTKIFEYLYSAKPILALTYKTELGKIIKETNSGWVAHPNQKELIKERLKKIIENDKVYNSSNRNLEKINLYSINEQIKILDLIIKKIIT